MRIVIVFLILICLTACQFNTKRQNNHADREEAELVTEKFYAFMRSEFYSHTFELFSKNFYEYTSQNELLDLYNTIHAKLGVLKDARVEQWETLVVIGTNAQSVYKFIYRTRYERFEAIESFSLTKEPDGKIRIDNYQINSTGFDPPA